VQLITLESLRVNIVTNEDPSKRGLEAAIAALTNPSPSDTPPTPTSPDPRAPPAAPGAPLLLLGPHGKMEIQLAAASGLAFGSVDIDMSFPELKCDMRSSALPYILQVPHIVRPRPCVLK
jgi:hypothetical protein